LIISQIPKISTHHDKAFSLWLACHTQEEIADAVEVDKATVSRWCDDLLQSLANEDCNKWTDFDPPIYNVWKQDIPPPHAHGSTTDLLHDADDMKFTRAQAATDAGLSERQRKMAERIQARAIRRYGELLKQIPDNNRGRPSAEIHDADDMNLTRTQAARDAGISERQKVTALRIANIPDPEFDALIESDNPPTITKLAELGKQTPITPVMLASRFGTHTRGHLQAPSRRHRGLCMPPLSGVENFPPPSILHQSFPPQPSAPVPAGRGSHGSERRPWPKAKIQDLARYQEFPKPNLDHGEFKSLDLAADDLRSIKGFA